MKWLIVILVALFSLSFIGTNPSGKSIHLKRDTVPTGAAPQLFGSKLYEFRNYMLVDSFLMVQGGDTTDIPRWPALKYKNSDNRWYGYHGTRWRAFLNGTDTISLSNRIDNSGGGGVIYIFSSSAPTGRDTAKLWAKTPAIAGVYDIYQYASGQFSWVRYGWLSIDGFFSPLPPINTVIAGQSNAAGSYPGGDTARVSGILGYTSGVENGGIDDPTHWEQATIGKSPFFLDNNNIGFQFAKRLRLNEKRIVRIVATYQGGVGLSAWLCGSPHYLLDTLRNRLSRSGIDTLHAFLWHHGESGGCRGNLEGGYLLDMRDFYDSLCLPSTKGFIRNYTQFIAGELGGLDAANQNTQWPITNPNGAIRAMNFDANLNTGSVPSYGLSRCDDTHFCGTALDSLGYYYYTEYKKMPHSPSYEQNMAPGNFDTTFEQWRYNVNLNLEPPSGSGLMYKYYTNSFAYSLGGFKTIAINNDGTVGIANADGISGTNNSRLKVNGNMSLIDGTNSVIATNFNPAVTGGFQRNIIFANYLSNFTLNPEADNVFIGYNAGATNSRMSLNSIMIGSNAGSTLTPAGAGDYNIGIGKDVFTSNAVANSTIAIGYGNGAGMYGGGNTLVGHGVVCPPNISLSSAIGYQAKLDSNYQIALGDTTIVQLKVGKLRFKINSTPTNGQYYAYNNSSGIFELTNPTTGSVDSVSIAKDSVFTNSNTVKVAMPFMSFRNRRVAIQVDTLFTTSTSFGTSYGLSNVNQGNFEILADRLKMTLLNHSMGGLDIQAACVEVSNNIRPGVNKYMQVNAVGYNLLRYAGNNDSAYKQLQDGIRSIIGTNIIDTILYGDNARVVQHGTWGTSTYSSYGGKSGAFGGVGIYTNAINDSLNINITGDAILIGYINQIAPGGESGTFNIYVDNVLRKTVNAVNACGVSDGTYTNATTPGAVLLYGLGAGMHAVKIVNTQAKYLYFDYIATTKATNECAPVIISLIPKMTAVGYAVVPSNGSDAIFNKGDSVIMATVNEFSNYPVTVAYPNDYFNPATMTLGDNVHPTADGQAAIAYANSIQIFTSEKVPAGTISQWLNTTGGIYYPSGRVGIGATATSPATALQIKSDTPSIRIDDTGGDNAAFLGNFSDFAQLSINRNPTTGTFKHGSKAAAQISLRGEAGNGAIEFYTTNTNGGSPQLRAFLNGVGNWWFGSVTSPTALLHLPPSSATAGTAPIKLEGGVRPTVVEDGALVFDTVLDHTYFGINNTWWQLDQQGGTSYTFSNGLTESGGAATWGGTLTQTATIDGGSSFTSSFTSSRTGTNSTLLSENTSSGRAITGAGTTGIGIYGTSTSSNGVFGQSNSGNAVFGLSSSGVGVQAQSTTGQALTAISPNSNGAAAITSNPSSTNTTHTVLNLSRLSTSAGANNIAGAIDYNINNTTGSGTTTLATRLISKLTTATTSSEVSQFEIWGVNSGTLAKKLSIAGNGQITEDSYGAGTFSVTPATTPVYSSSGVKGERIAPKIYTALLSQTGTSDPTVTVLGTNEIGTVVWTRNSTGNYTGTLTSAFPNNKTWAIVQRGDMAGTVINSLLSRTGDNAVNLTVIDGTGSAADGFTNLSIEIRVYP